jgi:hypothetical protein
VQDQHSFYPYSTNHLKNAPIDIQTIHQRIANIERQLDMLMRMIEYNNQMLRYMQQNNINNTAGSGGGAIIVRM